jgi:hypothetical protein
MKRPTQSLSLFAGIAGLGAALIWSYTPLTTSHASNSSPSTEPRPVAVGSVLPAAGFTDVAKTVTPAVVNITTSGAEEVSDGGRHRGTPGRLLRIAVRSSAIRTTDGAEGTARWRAGLGGHRIP